MGPEPRALAVGKGEGPTLILTEPLSFWGGVDPATGRIVDARHPQHGRSVTGVVLAMPAGRGSSSSSTVLAECIRAGTGPRAIVLAEPDPILAVGSTVASELYGIRVPVVAVERERLEALRDGDTLRVTGGGDGTATVRRV
jgi:predicted aconitase with swiveling domain